MRRSIAAVVSISSVLCAGAAPLESVEPPSVPSAVAAPGSAEPDIAAYVAGKLTELGLVGAGIGVVRPDGATWARGFGLADREKGVAATSQTISSWASSGKVVVCAAVMRALEANAIAVDAPIKPYLPFEVVNPAFPDAPITFRMLLVHTSSIHHDRAISNRLAVTGDPAMPLGEFLREYLVPGGRFYAPTNYLATAPGKAWEYCNIAYSLLAFLVERITGTPFDVYCRKELFTPLGMRDSSWFLRDLDSSRVALQYVPDAANPGTLRRVEHFSWPGYPDGSLRCSVEDMLRMLAMHLGGGRLRDTRVLSPAAVETIFTRQGIPGAWPAGRNPLVTIDSGLAWRLYDLDGRPVWSHNGGGGAGMSTVLLLEREAKAAAAAWLSGPVFDTKEGQAFFVELHHRLLAEMLRTP